MTNAGRKDGPGKEENAARVYVGQLCRLYPPWPPPPPRAASTSCPHLSEHPLSRAALCLFQSTSAGLDANGLP